MGDNLVYIKEEVLHAIRKQFLAGLEKANNLTPQHKQSKQHKGAPSVSRGSSSLSPTNCHAKTPVILLKYKRDPAEFHELLLTCPELQPYRDALKECGIPLELEGGAKVFVSPNKYEGLLNHLHYFGSQPHGSHVLVDEHLVETVQLVVQRLPRDAKVRRGLQEELPLVTTEHTFINVHLPSSLRSEPIDGPRTASTTDAHGLQNPR